MCANCSNHIRKENRKEICKYLFQEGVCYAKEDFNLAKHPEIDVPNLQACQPASMDWTEWTLKSIMLERI
ncbi:unnamed protein product [Lathyrus sativus]|nr:unnamed protein product [Lathyrus sativus]